MKALQVQSSAEDEARRAEKFYTRLRSRLSGWLKDREVSDRVRDYLLLLPDLFALVIRLLRDPRIEPSLKKQLLVVSAYVISPIDLIPDVFLPIGLLDDAVAMAIVLSRISRMMGQAGEDLLREYWEGDGDVLESIRRIMETADGLLHSGVLQSLRKLFK